MRNPINIDHAHSQAICQEIGERLWAFLKPKPELPASLREQVDQLRELEGQSPPIVPYQHGDEPSKDASEDQSRFGWPWR